MFRRCFVLYLNSYALFVFFLRGLIAVVDGNVNDKMADVRSEQSYRFVCPAVDEAIVFFVYCNPAE